ERREACDQAAPRRPISDCASGTAPLSNRAREPVRAASASRRGVRWGASTPGAPDHSVDSFREKRGRAGSPQTIAPSRPLPSGRASSQRSAGPRRERAGGGVTGRAFRRVPGRPGRLAPRAVVGNILSEGGGGGLPTRHPVRQATDCRVLSTHRRPAGRTVGQALAGGGADVLDWHGRKAVTAREGARRGRTRRRPHTANGEQSHG